MYQIEIEEIILDRLEDLKVIASDKDSGNYLYQIGIVEVICVRKSGNNLYQFGIVEIICVRISQYQNNVQTNNSRQTELYFFQNTVER